MRIHKWLNDAQMPITESYRSDLAYIHDTGYGAVARDAAAVLLKELARVGCQKGTVVDLGCGSGVLARAMVDARFHVVGIDSSEAMVALARTRTPDAEFRVRSFVSADLPSCVAVTAVGEVFNYLFDERNDENARKNLFQRIHQALTPGGLLLFDMAGPSRAKPGGPHRTFAQGADWAVLVESSFDAATGVLTRNITSFRQVGEMYQRDAEIHRLTLVEPDIVLRSLCTVGFEARIIQGYGEALPPGVVVYLARKSPDSA